jgi:hypothetical protein
LWIGNCAAQGRCQLDLTRRDEVAAEVLQQGKIDARIHGNVEGLRRHPDHATSLKFGLGTGEMDPIQPEYAAIEAHRDCSLVLDSNRSASARLRQRLDGDLGQLQRTAQLIEVQGRPVYRYLSLGRYIEGGGCTGGRTAQNGRQAHPMEIAETQLSIQRIVAAKLPVAAGLNRRPSKIALERKIQAVVRGGVRG